MNGHALTFPIDLCIYDLGRKILSPNGDNLENLWYTTIIAFGREYAFSLSGIECCQPRGTIYGEPKRFEHMGDTEIPYSIFFDFVLSLSENAFRPMSYDVRNHNSTKFCEEVLQFTCGVRVPKYLLELPQDDLFSSSWEELVMPLLKKVGAASNESSRTPLDLVARNHHVLLNYVPGGGEVLQPSRKQTREPSPDLIEIQAQIEAIRADQKSLKERRSKLRQYSSSSSPRDSVEREKSRRHSSHSRKSSSSPAVSTAAVVVTNGASEQHRRSSSSEKRNRSRQKSPHPNAKDRGPSSQGCPEKSLQQCNCNNASSSSVEAVIVHHTETQNEQKSFSKSRSKSRSGSLSQKSSLKKRVSFDETPVEISSREASLSKMVNGLKNGGDNRDCDTNCYDDIIDEFELPELQEDDLFSTYESLKAHASPSPPPLLSTDLSKEEKKTLGKAKSPPSSTSCPSMTAKPLATITAIASATKEPSPPQKSKPSSHEYESQSSQPPKPITFRELDHMGDFEEFVRDVIDVLTHEEQNRLYEMEMWIMNNEGVWVLDDTFIAFLGRVLHDAKSFTSDNRVTFLRLLAYGAEQEDFSMITHMDRSTHHIMNYAKDFESLPILEQEALALLFANMFETCSEWLLYISEWTLGYSTNMSNVKVTTKVAVSSLLGETSSLQDYGSAIMHNFSTKEVKSVVFDDVYTELTMAILQFLQGKPSEEKVFRCMKALDRFCTLSRREVPQLVKMIGPEPSKFCGMSSRVEHLCNNIEAATAKF